MYEVHAVEIFASCANNLICGFFCIIRAFRVSCYFTEAEFLLNFVVLWKCKSDLRKIRKWAKSFIRWPIRVEVWCAKVSSDCIPNLEPNCNLPNREGLGVCQDNSYCRLLHLILGQLWLWHTTPTTPYLPPNTYFPVHLDFKSLCGAGSVFFFARDTLVADIIYTTMLLHGMVISIMSK